MDAFVNEFILSIVLIIAAAFITKWIDAWWERRFGGARSVTPGAVTVRPPA